MKKMSLFLLSCILIFTMVPINKADAASFPDVTHYKDEIQFLHQKKIISGFPDGTFQPEKNLTRLQAVRMLLKANGITDFTAPDPKLTDMKPGKYGYAEVAKAVQLGIISGKNASNGTKYFDAGGELTRGQMAKIIVESQKYTIDKTNGFTDVQEGNGYVDYISTLAAEGITTGYADGTYKPNKPVTRQHFSVFTARMLDKSFKEPRQYIKDSFLMNTAKTYTYEYYEKGQTIVLKHSYVGKYNSPDKPDLWKAVEKGEPMEYLSFETNDGLYTAFPESHWYYDLRYPLFVGKTWSNIGEVDDFELTTVKAANLTVTTPAGTFKNVIKIESSNRLIVFYAPGTGVIKSLYNGKPNTLLVKME